MNISKYFPVYLHVGSRINRMDSTERDPGNVYSLPISKQYFHDLDFKGVKIYRFVDSCKQNS